MPIYFKESGTGTPVILIHGFCETHELWEQFAKGLSEFRIIMPDLPGFGRSPLEPSMLPLTIDKVASEMIRWIEDQKIVRPIIIGHSLGGYVVLVMVRQRPDLFPGFGLFHSTAYPDSEERKAIRNKVIQSVTVNGVRPFISTFVPGLFYQKNNPWVNEMFRISGETKAATIVAYAEAMRDRVSSEDVLKNFDGPILMIAGEKDQNIPYEQSSGQVPLMKFPIFSGLKDAGHMGMFESEPETRKLVKDFVKLVSGSRT